MRRASRKRQREKRRFWKLSSAKSSVTVRCGTGTAPPDRIRCPRSARRAASAAWAPSDMAAVVVAEWPGGGGGGSARILNQGAPGRPEAQGGQDAQPVDQLSRDDPRDALEVPRGGGGRGKGARSRLRTAGGAAGAGGGRRKRGGGRERRDGGPPRGRGGRDPEEVAKGRGGPGRGGGRRKRARGGGGKGARRASRRTFEMTPPEVRGGVVQKYATSSGLTEQGSGRRSEAGSARAQTITGRRRIRWRPRHRVSSKSELNEVKSKQSSRAPPPSGFGPYVSNLPALFSL